jgi:hypothetical protein
MAIMWSWIHAELGFSPRPLTYEMVEQAVAQGVRGGEDLDWKQDLAWKKELLPAEVKEKKKWEFAKDVAAMANTRGGLIVLGFVRRTRGRSSCLGCRMVSETGRPCGRSPTGICGRWVDGLLIEALDGEDDAPGLIVAWVPPSADAPHVIDARNEMGIPFRNGQTRGGCRRGSSNVAIAIASPGGPTIGRR